MYSSFLKSPRYGAFKYLWFPILTTLLLIPVAQSNPLLFHTLVELFTVTIAIASFIVAWNTHTLAKNNLLLLLGCGYLSIAVLDLAHAFTFTGMPFFPIDNANTTLQFWIIARFYEAALFVLASFLLKSYLRRSVLVAIATLFTAIALFLVYCDMLPLMMVPETGLTDAKVISEYLIITMMLLSLILLQRKRKLIDRKVRTLTYTSIILTVLAEFTFTLYIEFHSSIVVIGHFLKLFSYWAIYVVLIESNLRQPFLNLARNATTYDALPEEIMVLEPSGIIRQVNQVTRNTFLNRKILGEHCHELQHQPGVLQQDCEICQSISHLDFSSKFEYHDVINKRWYEISLSQINSQHSVAGLVHVRRNITATKEAQNRFSYLNRLYAVLTHTTKALTDTKQHQEQVFNKIVNIVVNHGGFRMAWVGIVDDQKIVPFVTAGQDDGYVETTNVSLDDSPQGLCPGGRAVKTKKVSFINDTEQESNFEPWREESHKRGFRAVASVPLLIGDDVEAVLNIYSQTANVFDHKMLSLLAILGTDISTALTRLHDSQKHRDSQAMVQQLSQTVEQNINSIIVTDSRMQISYVNKAFSELTGYAASDVLHQPPDVFEISFNELYKGERLDEKLDQGQVTFERYNYRADSSRYWAFHAISAIRNNDDEITNYVITSQDHSDLHQAQQTIEKLAFYDPLTSLPNRRLLSDRLAQAIERANRSPDAHVAVMVFDLDNFKVVNDSLGHAYGDELLKHIGELVQEEIRAQDTLSRQGGDEFTIILSDVYDDDKMAAIANNIIEKISTPMMLNGQQIVVGASLGIAIYPSDANSVDTLLSRADMAMYHAKNQGKNNFQFYTASLNERAHHRLELESRLRLAIEQDQFELYYQPQICLVTKKITGVEALIRWNCPEQGQVSPLEFIPLAESTGLIGPIGDWVITTACHTIKQLQRSGLGGLKVAVNVSPFQFRQSRHLVAVIEQALESSGLAPECLTLELTESMLVDDIPSTIGILNSLRALNIKLAIDDFGTGYSSLNYLKKFPIDILKIDQSFTRDITTDANDKAIVAAVIALAHQLGMTALAEGVETVEHQQYLLAQGCEQAQGYLYCKPIPADKLITWCEAFNQP